MTVASVEFLHKLYGGTITPKRAKALSIPLTGEAYKAGSASLFPRPLHLVKRKGKAPLLMDEFGAVQYILLKSVTHQPDPNALPDWRRVEAAILQRARGLLARVLWTRP